MESFTDSFITPPVSGAGNNASMAQPMVSSSSAGMSSLPGGVPLPKNAADGRNQLQRPDTVDDCTDHLQSYPAPDFHLPKFGQLPSTELDLQTVYTNMLSDYGSRKRRIDEELQNLDRRSRRAEALRQESFRNDRIKQNYTALVCAKLAMIRGEEPSFATKTYEASPAETAAHHARGYSTMTYSGHAPGVDFRRGQSQRGSSGVESRSFRPSHTTSHDIMNRDIIEDQTVDALAAVPSMAQGTGLESNSSQETAEIKRKWKEAGKPPCPRCKGPHAGECNPEMVKRRQEKKAAERAAKTQGPPAKKKQRREIQAVTHEPSSQEIARRRPKTQPCQNCNRYHAGVCKAPPKCPICKSNHPGECRLRSTPQPNNTWMPTPAGNPAATSQGSFAPTPYQAPLSHESFFDRVASAVGSAVGGQLIEAYQKLDMGPTPPRILQYTPSPANVASSDIVEERAPRESGNKIFKKEGSSG